LTSAPKRFARRSVSGTTSNASRPPPFSTTVRQTPSTEIESPRPASSDDSTTSRPSSNDATLARSRTMPVNMPKRLRQR
jgi:hypothetical protein